MTYFHYTTLLYTQLNLQVVLTHAAQEISFFSYEQLFLLKEHMFAF